MTKKYFYQVFASYLLLIAKISSEEKTLLTLQDASVLRVFAYFSSKV